MRILSLNIFLSFRYFLNFLFQFLVLLLQLSILRLTRFILINLSHNMTLFFLKLSIFLIKYIFSFLTTQSLFPMTFLYLFRLVPLLIHNSIPVRNIFDFFIQLLYILHCIHQFTILLALHIFKPLNLIFLLSENHLVILNLLLR